MWAGRGVDRGDAGIAGHVVATLHPSAVLRARDADARQTAMSELVADLQLAADILPD